MPRQNRGKRLPADQVRSKQVNAYVDPKLKKRLQAFAKKESKSESDVVMEALESFLPA